MQSINIKNILRIREVSKNNGTTDKSIQTAFLMKGRDCEIYSSETKKAVDLKVYQAQIAGLIFIEVAD